MKFPIESLLLPLLSPPSSKTSVLKPQETYFYLLNQIQTTQYPLFISCLEPWTWTVSAVNVKVRFLVFSHLENKIAFLKVSMECLSSYKCILITLFSLSKTYFFFFFSWMYFTIAIAVLLLWLCCCYCRNICLWPVAIFYTIYCP